MSVTDVLRGLYVKCPYRVRAYLSPLLSILPTSFKYGPTYRRYKKDIDRSEADPKFVEEYRLKCLKRVITNCWERNPYYAQLFRTAFGEKFNPKDFSLDHFQNLPILSKDDVRIDPERFLIKNISDVDLATTSGTSGVPLKFYLDRDRSVKEWAFVHHLWARNGYRPGMRIAVLRGVKLENVDKNWK